MDLTIVYSIISLSAMAGLFLLLPGPQMLLRDRIVMIPTWRIYIPTIGIALLFLVGPLLDLLFDPIRAGGFLQVILLGACAALFTVIASIDRPDLVVCGINSVRLLAKLQDAVVVLDELRNVLVETPQNDSRVLKLSDKQGEIRINDTHEFFHILSFRTDRAAYRSVITHLSTAFDQSAESVDRTYYEKVRRRTFNTGLALLFIYALWVTYIDLRLAR